MRLPEFSAEASFYRTKGHYYTAGSSGYANGRIQPAQDDPLLVCLHNCIALPPVGDERGRCRCDCFAQFRGVSRTCTLTERTCPNTSPAFPFPCPCTTRTIPFPCPVPATPGPITA